MVDNSLSRPKRGSDHKSQPAHSLALRSNCAPVSKERKRSHRSRLLGQGCADTNMMRRPAGVFDNLMSRWMMFLECLKSNTRVYSVASSSVKTFINFIIMTIYSSSDCVVDKGIKYTSSVINLSYCAVWKSGAQTRREAMWSAKHLGEVPDLVADMELADSTSKKIIPA